MTEWSTQQQRVLERAESGTGHTVVEARAGSGKTTTIVGAAKKVTGRSLLAAFNKAIAEELARRFPQGSNVAVKTLHGLGFGALRSRVPSATVDGRRNSTFLKKQYGSIVEWRLREAALKLTSWARNTMTLDVETWHMLVQRRVSWDVRGPSEEQLVIEMATKLMGLSDDVLKGTATIIDFDDMIFLPVVGKLTVPKFPTVFVDEAQDLNRAQHLLVEETLSKHSRLFAVGDSYQAIYGFRGAASQSMKRLQDRFGADVIPLDVSFRCPQAVVRYVQSVVPDFYTYANAPEGAVTPCDPDFMEENAAPGDFILSRINAPLLGICLRLWRRGVPAAVMGRGLGKALQSMIKRSKTTDVESLLLWGEEWVEKESAKRRERDEGIDTSDLSELLDCLRTICEGETGIPAIEAKIEKLFRDGDPHEVVALSTTHKAKGLERQRVWMLRDTYLRQNKNMDGVAMQEERNLFYVAATRAMSELYVVSGGC